LRLEQLQPRHVLDGETIEFLPQPNPAGNGSPVITATPTAGPADVNASGQVTPINALLIIN